jgi:hypothetical protein
MLVAKQAAGGRPTALSRYTEFDRTKNTPNRKNTGIVRSGLVMILVGVIYIPLLSLSMSRSMPTLAV